MRHFLGLVIGLVIGIAGATLYIQSLPPEPDSLRDKVEKTEIELRQAKKQIAVLESAMPKVGRSKPGETFRDRSRRIAEDIRAGKLVDVDDVFGAFKPIMRDLSPLFDRIRERDQKKYFDTVAGQYSREYDLTPAQQEAFKRHLEQVANESAARYTRVMTSEKSTLEDFVRASRDLGRDDSIDDFMERTLKGEQQEQFKTDRLMKKVERVQNEADRKVQRLNSVVELDEGQKDQVFAFMARSSQDFDPAMQFEGLAGDTTPLVPGRSRNDAILEVLRPDQRATYEEHRRVERETAEADLNAIGLTLPKNWDVWDEDDL